MTDDRTLSEFQEYMKEGRTFRDEVVKHMITTSINSQNFLEYVRTCDRDRDAQEKRIAQVETSQAVQKGILAAGLATLPFVGPILDWLKK